MPPRDTMNQQSDEGFLNESFLLSRQRGLLSQLNVENERRRRSHQFFQHHQQQQQPQQQELHPHVSVAAAPSSATADVHRAGASVFGYDAQSLMNRPIIENNARPMPFHQAGGSGSGRGGPGPISLMNQPPLMHESNRRAGGHDTIFSQRLSLGFGGGVCGGGSGGGGGANINNMSNNDMWSIERDLHNRPLGSNPSTPQGSNQHDIAMMKDPLLMGDIASKSTMKRRRSSAAGFSFLSEDSFRSGLSDLSPLGDDDDSDERKVIDNSDIPVIQFEEQKLPAKKTASSASSKKRQKKTANQPGRKSRPNNPRKAHLKKSLEELASAMEKSAKSQQDIHNWDKKMGLKKSHSKTMRLSTRSRKKLLSSCRREIKALGRSSTPKKKQKKSDG